MTITLSRSFAHLCGLEIRGRGPFCVAQKDGVTSITMAFNLTAPEVAAYLEAHDEAQIRASGPCCLTSRKGTAK